MKKFVAVILAVLLLFSLSAWRTGRQPAGELKKLGIAPSMGKMTLRIDSRTGIHQKGTIQSVIQVPKTLKEQISKDERWNKLPMDQQLTEALHGDLKDFGKFLPGSPRGYYILLDKNPSVWTEKSGEKAYRFILAVYDTDRDTIYYCEVKQ